MVNGYLDNEAVVFYSVALTLAELIWLLPDSIGIVLFPAICAATPAQANRLTPKVSRHTLAISAIAALGLALICGPLIVLVYGPAFAPAALPTLLLLPGAVVFR